MTVARAHVIGFVAVSLAATAVVPSGGAATAATPTPRGVTSSTTMVGSLALAPCDVAPRALCGSLPRAWNPQDPGAGTISVGFAFVPARDRTRPATGTVLPREGGPGYSTTGSAASYLQAYAPLLQRRSMLLVDQRGTGRSAPIDCPALQNDTGIYAAAVAACGRQLGALADDYSTARSADDVAAVITALGLGKVDVYGDSYGTFFAQVFAGRHPAQVRTLVLDGAYPTYGENAWYRTTPATARRSLTAVCARSATCAAAGRPALVELSKVLTQVRATPYRGIGYDAEGHRKRVVVDAAALVTVAYGAGYGTTNYRELTAALRSALVGYRAPLIRLVAENVDVTTDTASAPAEYSSGAAVAVSCHEYPQLFDLRATPAVRRQQLAAAVRAKQAADPRVYAPFTIKEFLSSEWQELDSCLDWPAPSADNPAGPPKPPAGSYARIPTLVLSGELDTVTTPAEGRLITGQIPGARQVVVANSFHVTALGDTDGCAVRILRTFVSHPRSPIAASDARCARSVPPLRALGKYRRVVATMPAATNQAGSAADVRARRAATTAAASVADVLDRWLNSYSGTGVGLRGGSWSYDGDRTTTFALHRFRLVRDLAVTGKAVWKRYRGTMHVDLRLAGPAVRGHLTGHWRTRTPGARALLSGRIGGKVVRVSLPAP